MDAWQQQPFKKETITLYDIKMFHFDLNYLQVIRFPAKDGKFYMQVWIEEFFLENSEDYAEITYGDLVNPAL